MSTNALPNPQEAYDTLFEGVHSRVFFSKCAAAGFSPRTEEEAGAMLETAGKLRSLNENASVKAAAAQDNPFFRLNSSLDTVLDQYGLGSEKAAGDAETGYKQAAATLSQDPVIYNSVLSLKAAQAEQLKAEFESRR